MVVSGCLYDETMKSFELVIPRQSSDHRGALELLRCAFWHVWSSDRRGLTVVANDVPSRIL